MNELVIKKQGEYSAWVLASLVVEMAYKGLKKSYEKGSPRRIEFKILRDRLKVQLETQYFKNYTNDSVYLTFSPFDNDEIEWFIDCFIEYLDKNTLDKINKYKILKNDLLKQIEELKKVD